MKELLTYVSGLIVNEKDRLVIKEQDDGFVRKYTINVSKADIKSIIGREGMMIKAIRSMISMASINEGIKKKIPIERIDDECV